MQHPETDARNRFKIVDSNEPGAIREALLKIGWEQRRLEVSDYWFFTNDYKKVGIERKEVNDFLQSLGNRLTNQLERAIDHFDIVILLLEGNWKHVGRENRIMGRQELSYNTWEMAWNFIRAQQHKGVTIELTTSYGHTVQRLNELYAWYQKGIHRGGLSSGTFSDDRIMAFPKGSRGKTGVEVLKMFKSLVCVGNAEVGDLMNVPGIGMKKAQAIYDHFNRGISEIPEEQYKAEEVNEELDSELDASHDDASPEQGVMEL